MGGWHGLKAGLLLSTALAGIMPDPLLASETIPSAPPWLAWPELIPGRCWTPWLVQALRDPQRHEALERWRTSSTTPVPSLGSIRSSHYPLRVHYRLEEQTALAQEILGLAEASWQVEVEQLGFDPPEPDGEAGGDEALDLYLASYEDTGGSALTVMGGYDLHPEDGKQSCTAHIQIYEGLADEILSVTVAHELNHALQAAMDFREHPWVWEATATYVEDVVFDAVNDYTRYVPSFQEAPEQTLLYFSQALQSRLYPYGGAVFIRFLHDRYFNDRETFIRELWTYTQQDETTNEPDFLDGLERLLGETQETTFDRALQSFAQWRIFTGERAQSGWMEEAELWEGSEVPFYFTLDRAELPARGTFPELYELGTQYLAITSGDSALPGTLSVRVTGASDHCYGISATLLPTSGKPVLLDPHMTSRTETSRLELPEGSVGTLVLAVTDLARTSFDPDAEALQSSVTVEVEGPGCGCSSQAERRTGTWAGYLVLLLGLLTHWLRTRSHKST